MCCGKNRAAARADVMTSGRVVTPAAYATHGAPPSTESSVIMFESVAGGATVVRGPVSGRVYRFAGAGDRVHVDARDRPGLVAMVGVRWVR
mgnify:CR=1 FL=1